MDTSNIFELTLSGPGKNALSSSMLSFILAELDRAAGAPVLITGGGDVFSAGLDLKEVASRDGETMIEFLTLLEACMTALYLYPGPIVGLINGHAIAGGAVVALCCDVRVAASRPNMKIGLNEVALGLRFPPRILSIVRRRLPSAFVEEVLLGAALYDPAAALRVGLVDVVADDPAPIARARLAALAAHPAEAYALTKGDLRGNKNGLCPDDEEAHALAGLVAQWTAGSVRQKIATILKR